MIYNIQGCLILGVPKFIGALSPRQSLRLHKWDWNKRYRDNSRFQDQLRLKMDMEHFELTVIDFISLALILSSVSITRKINNTEK